MPRLQTDLEFREHQRTAHEGHYQELHKLVEAVRQRPHERWFIVDIGDCELYRPVYERMAEEYKEMGYGIGRGKGSAGGRILKFTRQDSPKPPIIEPSAPPPYVEEETGQEGDATLP